LVFSEVHMGDVLQHIKVLDIHKAVGIDQIPTRFVKAVPYGRAVILTKLIDMSISTCTFPDENCYCYFSSKIQTEHLFV